MTLPQHIKDIQERFRNELGDKIPGIRPFNEKLLKEFDDFLSAALLEIAEATRKATKLQQKDEGEGWDVFFAKKGQGVCCPGDDIADGWNLAISSIESKLDSFFKG